MRTGILWNTFGRDVEWFRYSVASYRKFASGWDDAVCLVPQQDRELFSKLCDDHGIRLQVGTEWGGAGFNWHQMQQCCADLWLPRAEAIWHIDSDTVFTQPVNPSKWMEGGKLICGYKRFSHLNAIAKTETHSGIWKHRVDAAIGGDVLWSTMVTPPYCHYSGIYRATRRMILMQHPEGFANYVRSCQNEFPQGFAEFETLGAIAQQFYRENYIWRNVENGGHPSEGLVAEGWSHGGLDLITDRFDGKRTARQVFKDLGL